MRPIDFFDSAAERYPGEVALVDAGGATMTFLELSRLTYRVAAALTRITDGKPLPVGILSPNHSLVVVCTVGIMRAGAVVTALHERTGTERNLRYLRDVEPCVVFYHSLLADAVNAFRSSLSPSIRWVCIDGPGDGLSLDEFTSGTGEFTDRWGDAFGNPARPVYIRQTSGTAGTPKMIVGDVASYQVTHSALQQRLRVNDVWPICLVATPISHAAGVHAFAMLTLGATLVIMKDFEAKEVLNRIEGHKVTHMWLPASALYLLLSCPRLSDTDCSSLRSVLLGASAISGEKLKEAVATFGPCVAVNYAQIEGGFLTWLDETTVARAAAGHHPERLTSSGLSMDVGRLAVMDEQGNLVPRGQTGELVVRGPSVKPYIMKPFVLDTVELAKSQSHGWHHTGDLGYIDPDGYVYVVGRKKDLVITGGFKVSVAEVERAIMELPEISECVAIGVPDDMRGEAVKAIVVARAGKHVSARQILTHCRARLGRLHAPVTVEHWSELPRNAGGKIDRQLLRSRFWKTPTPDVVEPTQSRSNERARSQ